MSCVVKDHAIVCLDEGMTAITLWLLHAPPHRAKQKDKILGKRDLLQPGKELKVWGRAEAHLLQLGLHRVSVQSAWHAFHEGVADVTQQRPRRQQHQQRKHKRAYRVRDRKPRIALHTYQPLSDASYTVKSHTTTIPTNKGCSNACLKTHVWNTKRILPVIQKHTARRFSQTQAI